MLVIGACRNSRGGRQRVEGVVILTCGNALAGQEVGQGVSATAHRRSSRSCIFGRFQDTEGWSRSGCIVFGGRNRLDLAVELSQSKDFLGHLEPAPAITIDHVVGAGRPSVDEVHHRLGQLDDIGGVADLIVDDVKRRAL